MTVLTIRFEGLCCHMEPPPGSPIHGAIPIRTVLPDASAPPHVHICYIECLADDCDQAANPGLVSESHMNNVQYLRAEFTNVRIALANTIISGPLEILPSYHQRVPKLQQITPDFQTLRAGLMDVMVPTGIVAAYFDMTVGTLSAGPSEVWKTGFEPKPAAWSDKRLAEWAQLDVVIADGEVPMFDITDLANPASTRRLTLKAGADMVTIGNQMWKDVVEKPPDGRQGHFPVYYTLADPQPAVQPTPKGGLGLGTGCSNSNFP